MRTRPSPDAVFDAAMKRAGTVRVRTYTQLFAAARILAMAHSARRSARDRHQRARSRRCSRPTAPRPRHRARAFAPATERALDALLPPEMPRAQSGRCARRRDAGAFRGRGRVVLADRMSTRCCAARAAARHWRHRRRARGRRGRARSKPVLGAWLGAVDRPRGARGARGRRHRQLLHAGERGRAFSFLAAYRRHQEWLLEVPPPQPEPEPPDLAAAEGCARRRGGTSYACCRRRKRSAARGVRHRACRRAVGHAGGGAAAARRSATR